MNLGLSGRLTRATITSPLTPLILIAALAFGLLALMVIPREEEPQISVPMVDIIVQADGLKAPDAAELVTKPLEQIVKGINGVEHVYSQTQDDRVMVTARFFTGTSEDDAILRIQAKVRANYSRMPLGIPEPLIVGQGINDVAIVSLTLSPRPAAAGRWTEKDLFQLAEKVQAELDKVDNVGLTYIAGGTPNEISVEPDPERLSLFGVTLQQLEAKLQGANRSFLAGSLRRNGRMLQAVAGHTLDGVPDIGLLLITTRDGRPVYVRDVAQVIVGPSPEEQHVWAMTRGPAGWSTAPAATIAFAKRAGANAVVVSKALIAQAQALKGNVIPADIDVEITRDYGKTANDKANELLFHLGLATLSIVLLIGFVVGWREAAVTLIVIPTTILLTLFAANLMGYTINRVSLFALIFSIGILVDDAIVEIENIEKRVERGQTPYRAALVGADSIGLAVVATTSTIVAVFLPVSFMPGIPGQFFKEFGLTVSVAVLFSLVVARFATPPMAAYFLKAKAHAKPPAPLGGFYKKTLDWALHHRWAASILGGLIFFVSLGVMASPLLPKGFQPIADSGYFYLQMEGPPGVTREGMDRAVREVTRRLRAYPDVETVFAQTGSSSGGSGFGPAGGSDVRDGTITVVLKDHRSMTTDAFKKRIRPMLREIPDVRITTQGAFGAADVNIVLSSEDTANLEKTQLELEKEMRSLSIISDVRPSPPPAGPELQIRPKPDEASRLGVTSQALASVLRVATIGDIDANVAKYSEGKRRIPIRVRLPEDQRQNLDAIKQLQVPTSSGKLTPLETVADITFEAGPAKIVRYQREREVIVQADLNGSVLGSALAAVNKLPVMKHLPPTVKQAQIGDAEAMIELFGGMIMALLTGIGLIYAVLVLLFRSFFKPAVIMAALPLTLFGAVVGLLVGRMEIDMPAMIGVLMLMGLAAKNSILLVEFAIEDERAGQPRLEALMNACRERARPIIMTTMAMAAGMLPTALGLGQGSEFRQPMAIAVIGGLITSTALSLVLVPVIYEIIDDVEQWLTPKFSKLVTRKQPGDDDPIHEGEETLVTDNG